MGNRKPGEMLGATCNGLGGGPHYLHRGNSTGSFRPLVKVCEGCSPIISVTSLAEPLFCQGIQTFSHTEKCWCCSVLTSASLEAENNTPLQDPKPVNHTETRISFGFVGH